MENIQMKTGFNMFESAQSLQINSELETKITALMILLLEKAIIAAETYSKHTGLNVILVKHIVLGLQYETHEFFNRPELDEEFSQMVNEINEDNENYQSDDEPDASGDENSDTENNESDYEGSEPDASGDEDEEKFIKSECDCHICTKCNIYDNEWDQWNPDDEIIIRLKNAINKIRDTNTL